MRISVNATILPAENGLTFNPNRFARLGRDDLFRIACEWMNFETAFGMCLNAASLHGEKELAHMLASRMGQAKLAQAFYLYRTAGLIDEAMKLAAGPVQELIRPGAPLNAIVFDAIEVTRTARPDLHKELLRKIIAAAPDLKWGASLPARLFELAREALDDNEAEAFGTQARTSVNSGSLCIAGLTRVRNEGELVAQCVGNMLKFCDFVLVFDHNSTDGCADEARVRYGENVEVLRQPDMELFDEKLVNEQLFNRAREKKATHMVLVDADELASPLLADAATVRSYAHTLAPGEVLTVPYRQVWETGFVDYERFRGLNDGIRFLPPYRDFLYCDDGRATHRSMKLHNPWLPDPYPTRRHYVGDPLLANIHFEKAYSLNGMLKNDLYILRELFHFNTPLPTVLSRYLAPHLIHNTARDTPPPADPLATAPCEHYKTLCNWRLRDARTLLPRLPPPARFLLNFSEY